MLMARSVRFDFTPPDDWDPDGTARQAWDAVQRGQQELIMLHQRQQEERLRDIVRQVAREEIMQVLKDANEAEELGLNVHGYVVDHLVRRMSQTQERMQG